MGHQVVGSFQDSFRKKSKTHKEDLKKRLGKKDPWKWRMKHGWANLPWTKSRTSSHFLGLNSQKVPFLMMAILVRDVGVEWTSMVRIRSFWECKWIICIYYYSLYIYIYIYIYMYTNTHTHTAHIHTQHTDTQYELKTGVESTPRGWQLVGWSSGRFEFPLLSVGEPYVGGSERSAWDFVTEVTKMAWECGQMLGRFLLRMLIPWILAQTLGFYLGFVFLVAHPESTNGLIVGLGPSGLGDTQKFANPFHFSGILSEFKPLNAPNHQLILGTS